MKNIETTAAGIAAMKSLVFTSVHFMMFMTPIIKYAIMCTILATSMYFITLLLYSLYDVSQKTNSFYLQVHFNY